MATDKKTTALRMILLGGLALAVALAAASLPTRGSMEQIGRFGFVVGAIGIGMGLILVGIGIRLGAKTSCSENPTSNSLSTKTADFLKQRNQYIWKDTYFKRLFLGLILSGFLLFGYLAYVTGVGMATGTAPMSLWIATPLIIVCFCFIVGFAVRGTILTQRFKRMNVDSQK